MKIQMIFLVSLLFALGCQTAQKVPEGPLQKAKWETRAVIKDLEENKSHQVSIGVVAIKNHRLRMDITATLGFNVATFVMGKENFRCAIYPEKKFFEGPISEKSMAETLNVPISPRALYAIAFDEPIRLQGWRCDLDAQQQVKTCSFPTRNLKVEWVSRTEGKKVVKMTTPKIEMSWLFYPPETQFEEKESLFNLSKPDGFVKQTL